MRVAVGNVRESVLSVTAPAGAGDGGSLSHGACCGSGVSRMSDVARRRASLSDVHVSSSFLSPRAAIRDWLP